MQVVTSENYQQLIETGKVPEFKPPEAPKADAKVEEPVKEPTRAADGTFTEAKADKVDEKAAVTAEDDEGLTPEERARFTEQISKKIGAKHRQMKEAEEFGTKQYLERLEAEKRAEALERELNELKEKSRPAPVAEKAQPKPEDFTTVAEYTDALTDWKVEKKFKEKEEQQAQAKAQADAEAAAKAFQTRLAAAIKEIPDYQAVIDGSDAVARHHILNYLIESDIGPKLQYHLAKNPDVLDRLNSLSPIKAIAELGKLETKLETKAEPKVETAKLSSVSQAPAPITPIEGKSTPVHKDPATMTFQELREYERAREAAKRKR
jgi:hypothetical protein